MAYAAETGVPVERSRAEIETLLRKYKCSQFIVGSDHERHSAMVQFKAHNRIVRFTVKLPDPAQKEYTHDRRGMRRSPTSAANAVAQGERQRWRALLLVIKAKLESVESKIASFEEEFLAHIVMPNDQTVGDILIPEVARIYETGKMPRLMLTEGQASE